MSNQAISRTHGGIQSKAKYFSIAPFILAVAAFFSIASLYPANAANVIRLKVVMQSSGGVQAAAVACGGQVLLRLRGNDRAELEQRAGAVVTRLEGLALAGLRPGELSAKPVKQDAEIAARGVVVATADAETARLSGVAAGALAEQWAHAIRSLLTPGYVVVSPADELAVPLGEERIIRWGGTAPGRVCVTSAPGIAAVEARAGSRQIVVRGVQIGEGNLRLDAAGQSISLPVVCRKWAARIADPSPAMVTGALRPALTQQALRNAALSAVEAEPDASVALEDISYTGQALRCTLVASGVQYFTARREVSVRLQRADAPRAEAGTLVVSNNPERVKAPRRLAWHTCAADERTRLLWHHLNDSAEPMRFSVRLLNLGSEAALVHASISPAGPLADEIGAGHRAMLRFVEDRDTGSGIVLRLPPGSGWNLTSTIFRPRQIVSGLAQFALLKGSQVAVEVTADPAGAASSELFNVSAATPGQIARVESRYVFDARKPLSVTHTIGGAWTFLPIGREARGNDHGRSLEGEYGVLYDVGLTIRNEKPMAEKYEIAVRGGGGAARGTFVIGGQIVETGLLTGGIEEVIARGTVPAASDQKVRLLTIPESGSYYPVTLTVRSARD